MFNHSFTYELPHREVLKRTLMLKVLDLDKSNRQHHVIGQVQLALSEVNLIKGVHLWKRIRMSSDNPVHTDITSKSFDDEISMRLHHL